MALHGRAAPQTPGPCCLCAADSLDEHGGSVYPTLLPGNGKNCENVKCTSWQDMEAKVTPRLIFVKDCEEPLRYAGDASDGKANASCPITSKEGHAQRIHGKLLRQALSYLSQREWAEAGKAETNLGLLTPTYKRFRDILLDGLTHHHSCEAEGETEIVGEKLCALVRNLDTNSQVHIIPQLFSCEGKPCDDKIFQTFNETLAENLAEVGTKLCDVLEDGQ